MKYFLVYVALCSVCFLLCSPPTKVNAEVSTELTLSKLLRKFSKMPGLQADFREEKYITLLKAPIKSQGTLHFTPPGKLARHVTLPSSMSMLIENGRIQFSDGEKTGSFDRNSNPLMQYFIDSFVNLLSGDEASLRRVYQITLNLLPNEDNGSWELILIPRPEALRRVLREVRVRGTGIKMNQMRIRETSGDETVTHFSNVNIARRYSKSEQIQYFKLPQQ